MALLHLITCVDDTNMISRIGLSAFRKVQEGILRTLEKNRHIPDLLEYANVLNERFIRDNMSPGGCADLLAATIFIDSLQVLPIIFS